MIFRKIIYQLLICFSILLVGCTMTTTKTKDPVFNDMIKVQEDLAEVVIAENINLNGKEITTNKKATSELEVVITNAEAVPTDDKERKSLSKSIATIIKNNLKEPNDFNKYEVLFVTKVENGAVTTSKSVGNVFIASEL